MLNIADSCTTAEKEPLPNDKTGNKDDLRLWKLRLIDSLLSPPCQDSLNWRNRCWDAVGRRMAATWALPLTQAGRRIRICLWCVAMPMAGTWWQGQTALLVSTMLTDATPGAADPAAEDKAKADNPGRHMNESSQGSKRAVAKSVAQPLRIQSSIHNTEDSSSKRPVAKTMQL